MFAAPIEMHIQRTEWRIGTPPTRAPSVQPRVHRCHRQRELGFPTSSWQTRGPGPVLQVAAAAWWSHFKGEASEVDSGEELEGVKRCGSGS